jgi:hypothetical protein
MELKNIFEKPVDRPIEGVIKADDESSIMLEIEEYVLTNEVSKRLDDFLDEYNNYRGVNGAWLSGFFGSGKSHLLKMLAYLLENKEIDGKLIKDIFISKCGDDKLLSAKIDAASRHPSKSILFNIDQKADIISKDQVDALLSVFAKVFDETCGYYGKQRFIAQFERDLDSDGNFEKFKNSYEKASGKSWEKGRTKYLIEKKHIDKAYAEISGAEEKDIIGKYRKDYKLSIEYFAELINDYISKQEEGFRLNFFVDEVGQYIANNVKLMTNLQTIAESLATKCDGKAWVIVTSQEDINSVIGDMSKQQGNDFSKIQARFNNRMKLTSVNVDEVIRRRLLQKTEPAKAPLRKLYSEQKNNFKTLFDFADGAKHYKNFKDEEHFVSSYPFIPYQFDLFKTCIEHLSLHNAFEGKHSSVGERSMLGVFQEVAKQITNHEIGQLATFDLMFEGVRNVLKGQIQNAVSTAEKHLDNRFAVQLLKALFLVKYVKDFKPTVRNLCVLMYDSFDCSIPALKKNIEEALNELEQQTYIQRNGEEYEFLTNEEKDIEEEIKHTTFDNDSLSNELKTLIFDSIIGTRKIRYDGNNHDYLFAQKLDDKLKGKDQELAIHVATPFHDMHGNEETIIAQSLGRSELLVILPEDDRLVKDLVLHQKTSRYIRQNNSNAQADTISRILMEKASQNHTRQGDIENRLKDLLSKSRMYVRGEAIEVSGTEPKTRITDGFITLIKKVYPNLQMLKGTSYTEDQIPQLLSPSNLTMFGEHMIESETEMLSSIKRSSEKGVRMPIRSLINEFQSTPYGWYQAAILCTLAKLCTRGKVELRSDGNLLDDSDLESAILNNRRYEQIIIEAQSDFSTAQVRNLKDFFKDFFDDQPRGQEAKALGQETAEEFKALLGTLKETAAKIQLYPFLESLKEPITEVELLATKQYNYFLTSLSEIEDKLMDYKENTIAPILSFMNGPQRKIYDELRDFLQEESANFDYIDAASVNELNSILKEDRCFAGDHMRIAKEKVDSVREAIHKQVQEEKEKAKKSIDVIRSKVTSSNDYSSQNATIRTEVDDSFNTFNSKIKDLTLIARIKDSTSQFEEREYIKILHKIAKSEDSSTATDNSNDEKSPKIERTIVSSRSISTSFSKPLIKNEADVDEYIRLLRESFMKEIDDGKQIQV